MIIFEGCLGPSDLMFETEGDRVGDIVVDMVSLEVDVKLERWWRMGW